MRPRNPSIHYLLPVLVGICLAATAAAPAALAREKKHEPAHNAGALSLSVAKAVNTKVASSASAVQAALVPSEKASPDQLGTAAAAAAQQSTLSSISGASQTAAATNSASVRLQSPAPVEPAAQAPGLLANSSQGMNPYAEDSGFTPLQTVQLLLLAAALGVFGYAFAQGAALDGMYRWLSRTIGVNAPIGGLQGQH